MQLGSVFIWNSFPFRKEGKEKNRYFVYFGESHYPDNPVKVFLITTTSKVNEYEEGDRKNHIHYKFKAGYFGFVEQHILFSCRGWGAFCLALNAGVQKKTVPPLFLSSKTLYLQGFQTPKDTARRAPTGMP